MSDIVEPRGRIERAWDFVKSIRGYLDGNRIGFSRDELAAAQQAAGLDAVSLGDAQTAYSDQLVVPLFEASAQALERIETAEGRIRQIRTYDGSALTTAEVALSADEPVLALELGPLSYAEIVVETGERTVPLRISTAAPGALRFQGYTGDVSLHCLDSLDGLPTENDLRKSDEVTPGWRLLEWHGDPEKLPLIQREFIQDGGIFLACGQEGASVFAWASRAATARVSLFRSVGTVSLPAAPLSWSAWHQSQNFKYSFFYAVKVRGIRSSV